MVDLRSFGGLTFFSIFNCLWYIFLLSCVSCCLAMCLDNVDDSLNMDDDENGSVADSEGKITVFYFLGFSTLFLVVVQQVSQHKSLFSICV